MNLRALAFAAAATTAVATYATTDVNGANTFAFLPVNSSASSTIIAVPFSGCGESQQRIYVTNLVMTANLSVGDTLLHKNGSGWEAWEIYSDGGTMRWRGVTVATANGTAVSAPASEVAINCGDACWLNRSSTGTPFFLYGQKNDTKAPVTVAAGTGSKPTYTIVGCPYEAGDFDVTTIAGAEGDTVILMANNDVGKVEYRYSGTAWQKLKKVAGETVTLPPFLGGGTETSPKTVWVDLEATDVKTVPAGCGFMYGRLANSTLTLTWGN